MPRPYNISDETGYVGTNNVPDIRTKVSFPDDRKVDADRIKKPDYTATLLVGGASLTIILSKDFFRVLGVERGDYVRIVQNGKRLIIEKDAEKRRGEP
jgi:hypothetical protein